MNNLKNITQLFGPIENRKNSITGYTIFQKIVFTYRNLFSFYVHLMQADNDSHWNQEQFQL